MSSDAKRVVFAPSAWTQLNTRTAPPDARGYSELFDLAQQLAKLEPGVQIIVAGVPVGGSFERAVRMLAGTRQPAALYLVRELDELLALLLLLDGGADDSRHSG